MLRSFKFQVRSNRNPTVTLGLEPRYDNRDCDVMGTVAWIKLINLIIGYNMNLNKKARNHKCPETQLTKKNRRT